MKQDTAAHVRDWRRLPAHPDWRLEVVDGQLVPRLRPKPLHLWRPTALPTPASRPAHTIVLLDGRRDRSRLPALVQELWLDQPPYCHLDTRDRHRRLAADLRTTLAQAVEGPIGAIALGDDGPTGLVLLSRPWTGRAAALDAPTMSWMVVRRGLRRRGIGSGLLRCVASYLDDVGRPWLASPVPLADRAALCWHLANGFRLNPADPVDTNA